MKIILLVTAALMGATTANAQLNAPSISGNQQPRYGNQFGNDSNSLRVYDSQGRYRGNLNDNRFDPNSVSNPFGQYGSRFSPDSLNNPYSSR